MIGGFCAGDGVFCGDLVSCAVRFGVKTSVEIQSVKQKPLGQAFVSVGMLSVTGMSVSGIRGFSVWGRERKNNQHKT